MSQQPDQHPDVIWDETSNKKVKYATGLGLTFIVGWISFLMVVLAPSCPSRTPEYLYDYGKHYMAENDFIKAEKFFTEAIKGNPRYYEAYMSRAKAWEQQDSIRNAIKDYDTLLTFSTTNVEKKAELYLLKANMHYLLSEDNFACRNWARACEFTNNKACDLLRKQCK